MEGELVSETCYESPHKPKVKERMKLCLNLRLAVELGCSKEGILPCSQCQEMNIYTTVIRCTHVIYLRYKGQR